MGKSALSRKIFLALMTPPRSILYTRRMLWPPPKGLKDGADIASALYDDIMALGEAVNEKMDGVE